MFGFFIHRATNIIYFGAVSLLIFADMSISKQQAEAAQSLINVSQKIVITNHISPDADAMGAALGLQLLLKQLGKMSTVIVPSIYADTLNFLPANDAVIVYENTESINQQIESADLIFHLDYNAYSRSGDMQEVLRASKAKRILIDHHQQPEDWMDVCYSDTAMSSTCEMIYHFSKAMNWKAELKREVATCLYAGIMTDTGNFRFSSTSPTTHRVVADLLEAGAQPQEIAGAIYDSNSMDRLKLLGQALDNMEVYENEKAVLIPLSSAELKNNNFKKGDTEGFVNYGLSLSGIVLSIFMTEQEDKVKMSFRSKGDFDVNQLARKYFEGGGHKNAAGGVSYDGLEKTLQKLRSLLPEVTTSKQD
jgi:phosphoesterase RecJ-like protein